MWCSGRFLLLSQIVTFCTSVILLSTICFFLILHVLEELSWNISKIGHPLSCHPLFCKTEKQKDRGSVPIIYVPFKRASLAFINSHTCLVFRRLGLVQAEIRYQWNSLDTVYRDMVYSVDSTLMVYQELLHP